MSYCFMYFRQVRLKGMLREIREKIQGARERDLLAN